MARSLKNSIKFQYTPYTQLNNMGRGPSNAKLLAVNDNMNTPPRTRGLEFDPHIEYFGREHFMSLMGLFSTNPI